MRILVSGASGTTGGEVLRQLKAGGFETRAITRSPESAKRLEADGHEVVLADLAAPGSLMAAVDGVDAVYVATSASPELPAQEGALAKAAAAAGVERFAKLSAISASADTPLQLARMHHESEVLIRQSLPQATMIRPNGFMQNTLSWVQQIPGGVVRAPVLDARWSIIDVVDVAAAAVAALTRDGHAGADYTCTGPEALSPREEIAILAELLGKHLAAEEVPLDAVPGVLESIGMSAWTAERITDLYSQYVQGRFEAVTDDVERATGRPARSYRQFAQDHLAAFGGG